MNSIDDLREIYDELYRSGRAAAATRTILPDGADDDRGATNVELLPVIAVQPMRARPRRRRLAPLAAAATIVALMGGAVLAVRPWSHEGEAPAGTQASNASPSVATPSASVGNTAGPDVAPPPPTWSAQGTADPASVGSSVRCYATADVGRSDNYFSVTVAGDGSSPVAAGPLALELCGNRWRDGILSTDPPYKVDNPPDNANLPVPELITCVLPADNSDEGVQEVAVLPGSAGACSELGLPVFTGGR